MIYLAYGAAGMLIVLMLLSVGCVIGWRANDAFAKYTHRRAAAEATEEERRQLIAQQQAFESMLSYNQDAAYGVGGAPGGERYE